jgi:hypothetical protein
MAREVLDQVGACRKEIVGRGEPAYGPRVARATEQLADLRGAVKAAFKMNFSVAAFTNCEPLRSSTRAAPRMSIAASECWCARGDERIFVEANSAPFPDRSWLGRRSVHDRPQSFEMV